MSINSISPTEFSSGVLVADLTAAPAGGSQDAFTAKVTLGASLDVQSTKGGIKSPQMTTAQRLALPATSAQNGMIVYDKTLQSLFVLENGSWSDFSSNGITGPGVSVVNDIVVFANTTGDLVADSGVSITQVPPPLLSLGRGDALITDTELSNVDILSFKDVGLIYTGVGGTSATYVCGLFPNSILGRSPNTVFGFANPSSPDAIVEMTEGAFLFPRHDQAAINALIDVEGMVVYNTTTDLFNFNQNGSWATYYGLNSPTRLLEDVVNFNVFVGQTAGNTTLSGSQGNTAMGSDCLNDITSGDYNTSYGFSSLSSCTTGSQNSSYGFSCLESITSANLNTGFGNGVFGQLTSGNGNTGVGAGAGTGIGIFNLTSCTFLGQNASATSSGLTNATAIGANAAVQISNAIVLGDGLTNVGIGSSSPAARLHVRSGNTAIFCDGSFRAGYVGTATSYTVQDFDFIIGVTSTASPRTITLPTASSGIDGRIVYIKDESGGASANGITINVTGGGNIDNATSATMNQSFESAAFYCNGTQWFVLCGYRAG